MLIQPISSFLGGVPQVSGSESLLDEEIGLAAAGNPVVDKCRVNEIGTDMVGRLEGTVAAEEVGITEATLWPLLPLPLGLGRVGLLEVVGTADTIVVLLSGWRGLLPASRRRVPVAEIKMLVWKKTII